MRHLYTFNESRAIKSDYPERSESEINKFVSDMTYTIELNHDVMPVDIDAILELILIELDKYQVEFIEKSSLLNKSNLEKIITIFLNIGYSVSLNVINAESQTTIFRYDKFFEKIDKFLSKNFKKTQNFDLKWNGPDITHHSILASNFNIEESFDRWNEGDESQSYESEIQFIFGNIFRFGYSIAGEEKSREMYKKRDEIKRKISQIRKPDVKLDDLSDETKSLIRKILKE